MRSGLRICVTLLDHSPGRIISKTFWKDQCAVWSLDLDSGSNRECETRIADFMGKAYTASHPFRFVPGFRLSYMHFNRFQCIPSYVFCRTIKEDHQKGAMSGAGHPAVLDFIDVIPALFALKIRGDFVGHKGFEKRIGCEACLFP